MSHHESEADRISTTLTERWTNVARTAAVTFGHTVGIIGAAGQEANLPGSKILEKMGDRIARSAVEKCGRDSSDLICCNRRSHGKQSQGCRRR